tara:strand:+ start:474 stop:704 length:231 start_codon:yes stop_codon:yes gene_type:complete
MNNIYKKTLTQEEKERKREQRMGNLIIKYMKLNELQIEQEIAEWQSKHFICAGKNCKRLAELENMAEYCNECYLGI